MNRLLLSVAVFSALCGFTLTTAHADAIVTGPNARITQIDTNWLNEGRFAVHVTGGQAGSPCSGWVYFNSDYLAEGNKDAHKSNLMLATTAMIMNKPVEIYADNAQCHRAISVRLKR